MATESSSASPTGDEKTETILIVVLVLAFIVVTAGYCSFAHRKQTPSTGSVLPLVHQRTGMPSTPSVRKSCETDNFSITPPPSYHEPEGSEVELKDRKRSRMGGSEKSILWVMSEQA